MYFDLLYYFTYSNHIEDNVRYDNYDMANPDFTSIINTYSVIWLSL